MDNGCGQEINCGTCPVGQACESGQCVADPCQNENGDVRECGTVPNPYNPSQEVSCGENECSLLGGACDNGFCKCSSDAACAGSKAGAYCNSNTRKCSECRTNTDCIQSGKGTVCNAKGICEPCLTNNDCINNGLGSTCVAMQWSGVTTRTCEGCRGPLDCKNNPSAPICALGAGDRGQCVECTSNTDCANKPYGKNKCDTNGDNKCVECLTSSDCVGKPDRPLCENGACVKRCTQDSDSFRCIGDDEYGGLVCMATPQTNPSSPMCFSTYLLRIKNNQNNFLLKGFAYVIEPHIGFNKELTVAFNYDSARLLSVYKSEEEEKLLKKCIKERVAVSEQNLGIEGGVINFGKEISINVPANALTQSTNFVITKYKLSDCTENNSTSTSISTIGSYNPFNSLFYLRNSNSAGIPDLQFNYGATVAGGLAPIAGDWDGDGKDTIGVYNPALSKYYLKNLNDPSPAAIELTFGAPGAGWIPFSGDWDGDGIDTIGIYNPAQSHFYLRKTNDPTNTAKDGPITFGVPGAGWRPIAGDWDGDGKDTIGIYNPAQSYFYLRKTNDPTNTAKDGPITFGVPGAGWKPIAADWDGDGIDTIGIYNPAQSKFYLRKTNNPANTEKTEFIFGSANAGLVPLAGDWDGGGSAIIASKPRLNYAMAKVPFVIFDGAFSRAVNLLGRVWTEIFSFFGQ